MRQLEIINKLKQHLEQQKEIDSCLLIGSFARKDATVRSDIDLQVILNSLYSNYNPIDSITQILQDDVKSSFYLEEKSKLVFYLGDDLLLCEVFLCKSPDEVKKYFLGSEIDQVSNSILFDKTQTLFTYLNEIGTEYKSSKHANRVKEIEKNLLEFQYRFESCSSAHAKSDGYKFYLLYNNALNCLVRMIYWANDGIDYSYLPPDFLTRYGHSINFLEHDGSMFLPKGNEIKRKLLDRFAFVIPLLKEKYPVKTDTEAIIEFCERVYSRDYFWNFRDTATYNPALKRGQVFRSTSLSNYQDQPVFFQLLKQNGITQIIDLRANDEVEQSPYKDDVLKSLKYVRASIDPRIQSEGFKSVYNTGTNVEIAYQYYAVECAEQVKSIANSVLNHEGASVIHCVAGRDRTGSMVSLLHLLSGASEDVVINDYLATGQNTDKKDIKIFLDLIHQSGGIDSFMQKCGLSEVQISELRKKIVA